MEAVPPPLRSIENLPASLITGEILTRVPTRAAVRTSVLSSEWRHRWKYIPELSFDDEDDDYLNIRNEDGIPASVIDRVLLVHSAPVRSFSLSNTNMTIPDTDPWLLSLAHNHHQSLSSLELRFHHFFDQPLPPPRPLHSSLFSFTSLQSLHLSNCSIPHSTTSLFFPLLTNLDLTDVHFPNIHFLQQLIYNSPKLTHLTLDSVAPPSPPKLIITNPNLRHFFGQNCNSITFAAAQALQDVEFVIGEDSVPFDVNSVQFDIVQTFPAGAVCNGMLRICFASTGTLVEQTIPRSMPNCFQNLNFLDMVVDFTNRGHMMLLLCVMRSAPNLQKILIRGNDREEHDRLDRDFWKKNFVGQLDNIQTVEIKLYLFLEAEIDFICYVLERARVLRRITISGLSDSAFLLNKFKLEVLRNHQRASPQAEIICEERFTQDES